MPFYDFMIMINCLFPFPRSFNITTCKTKNHSKTVQLISKNDLIDNSHDADIIFLQHKTKHLIGRVTGEFMKNSHY